MDFDIYKPCFFDTKKAKFTGIPLLFLSTYVVFYLLQFEEILRITHNLIHSIMLQKRSHSKASVFLPLAKSISIFPSIIS